MLPGMALAAKLAPPDVEVNATAIRWPVGSGRELHGYMAIPARARGRQPAVLVIVGRDTPDLRARELVRGVAQAGFVACTVNGASILPENFTNDLRATARWLANGRYGTGRIGAIGLSGGIAATLALAGDRTIAAAVTFGEADAPPEGAPLLAFRPAGTGWGPLTPRDASPTLGQAWIQAWAGAMAFLREHLT